MKALFTIHYSLFTSFWHDYAQNSRANPVMKRRVKAKNLAVKRNQFSFPPRFDDDFLRVNFLEVFRLFEPSEKRSQSQKKQIPSPAAMQKIHAQFTVVQRPASADIEKI